MANECERNTAQESDIKVDDLVVIKSSVFISFQSHCNSEDDIPKHNHGIVTKVISKNDRDEKGRYLHPNPFGVFGGGTDFVTFKMPNGEEKSMYSKHLRKLY